MSASMSDLYRKWVLICATKSVWFHWATSTFSSDFYREWVLILCHQICFILLSDICFGICYLQAVGFNFVPRNLFDFAEQCPLWCLISTDSEYRLHWLFFKLPVPHHIYRWYVECIVIHCLAHHPECFWLILLILLIFSLWVFNWKYPMVPSGSFIFTFLYIQNTNVDFCIKALQLMFPSLVCKPVV